MRTRAASILPSMRCWRSEERGPFWCLGSLSVALDRRACMFEHQPRDADVMDKISRRQFIGTTAIAGAALIGKINAQAVVPSPVTDGIPIIDSHIHLFDGTRTLGAGYMGSQAYRAVSKTSLPSMYSPLAKPTGIVGAIVVESSALIDDNLWYLEVCGADPFMVGVCGNLDPARPDFGQYVTHFAKDPLYRAIRSSRFYSADNGRVTLKQDQVANLKLLAQTGSRTRYCQSQYGANAGERTAGRRNSQPSHHHGPPALVRSNSLWPAGIRDGSERDGRPPQHLRQAV